MSVRGIPDYAHEKLMAFIRIRIGDTTLLNLIERFWRFVKKECLYAKYYEDFTEFKTAINNCIIQANTTNKKKIDSLITWNFQSLKNVKILTV